MANLSSSSGVSLKRRPKVRELLAILRGAGCQPVRCRGSHETWRAPDGRVATVVVNHLNDDASPAVIASVRRLLDAA